MKNQIRMITQAVLGISVICFCAFAVTSTNAAVERPERILSSPSLYEDAGRFAFIAFGDSPNTDMEVDAKKGLDICYDKSGLTPCDDSFPPDYPKGKDKCKKYSKEEKRALKIKFNEYRGVMLKQLAGSLKDKLSPAPMRSSFAVLSGDAIYHGGDVKYWKPFRDAFGDSIAKCPPRLFSVMGNRETCATKGGSDPMENYFNTYPCQVQEGKGLHYFAFYAGNSVFINLCSGGLGPWAIGYEQALRHDVSWNCTQGNYAQQMAWLEQVVDYGVAKKGSKHVFVVNHKPSYARLKHAPLAACNDPVTALEQLKADKHSSLDFFTFQSHNHTTELYKSPGGVTVLVAGSAGGPQRALYCDIIHEKPQPEEMFWKALGIPLNKRNARVNYFQVTVDKDNVAMQEICLTERDGGMSFELGATIDKDGNVTAPVKKDACRLDPLK